MAKIYSHSESRARGSVGMTTYRTIRGRVIQSQKIAPWDPSVDSVGAATRWNLRTALLGLISLFTAVHAQSIINSFNRTKHGSQRNYFTKRNYAALREALVDLANQYAVTRVVPAIEEIEDAIGAYAAAHPNTIYRVKKTGLDVVFLDGNWDDSDDPAAPIFVTTMQPVLSAESLLTSVSITGSNITSALKFKLDNVELAGSLSVAAGGRSAVFTPSPAPGVSGTQTLQAVVGSQVKKSVQISGEYFPSVFLQLLQSTRGTQAITKVTLGVSEFLPDSVTKGFNLGQVALGSSYAMVLDFASGQELMSIFVNGVGEGTGFLVDNQIVHELEAYPAGGLTFVIDAEESTDPIVIGSQTIEE